MISIHLKRKISQIGFFEPTQKCKWQTSLKPPPSYTFGCPIPLPGWQGIVLRLHPKLHSNCNSPNLGNFCQLPVVVSCWTSRGLKLGHCATSDGCVACNTSHPYVEVQGHLNKVPFANHHETIPPFATRILHCLRGRCCRTHLMTSVKGRVWLHSSSFTSTKLRLERFTYTPIQFGLKRSRGSHLAWTRNLKALKHRPIVLNPS